MNENLLADIVAEMKLLLRDFETGGIANDCKRADKERLRHENKLRKLLKAINESEGYNP